MIRFASRCLKIFFRDKSAVFFSLLAVFIIIGLYALFLGDVWVSSLAGFTGVRYMMDSWIMAGILAVTSVTTTMGALSIMVEDKSKKLVKDFRSSPVRQGSIAGGYILGSISVGIVLSLVTLVLAEIYIAANGGRLMDGSTLFKVLGLILLSNVTNISLVLFLASFFASASAFAAASTVIGTLIGFLTGIYLPIGQLPSAVQWVVKLFPVSHAAVLFRRVMMEDALMSTFSNAPAGVREKFELLMGVSFKFGDLTFTPLMSALVLLGSAAVFYTLSVLNISRKGK